MSASIRIFSRARISGSIDPNARPPEEAVMDEQQLRPLAGGAAEQLGMGGYAGCDRLDARRLREPAVRYAVVLESARIQDPVGLGEDLGHGGTHRTSLAASSGMGYSWSIGAWRSLVARTVRVGEVPSSNLGAPIAESLR